MPRAWFDHQFIISILIWFRAVLRDHFIDLVWCQYIKYCNMQIVAENSTDCHEFVYILSLKVECIYL